MSQTNALIEAGERRAQQMRPATFTYAGDTIPCSLGNRLFFEQLKHTLGGFQDQQTLHVKILRKDITPKMLAPGAGFFSGQQVIVTNTDPESPGCGEQFNLIIGKNNTWQPLVVQLNLESVAA